MPPPPPFEEIPVASSAAVPDPAGSTEVPVFAMDAGTSEGSGSVGTAGTYFGGTGTQVAAPGGHGTLFHVLNERYATVEQLVDWCTQDTQSAASHEADRETERATLMGLLGRQSALGNTLPSGATPDDPNFTARVSLCLHIRHEL